MTFQTFVKVCSVCFVKPTFDKMTIIALYIVYVTHCGVMIRGSFPINLSNFVLSTFY